MLDVDVEMSLQRVVRDGARVVGDGAQVVGDGAPVECW